ncbi:MAG: glycosyltransferase [Albidovulum sp.]
MASMIMTKPKPRVLFYVQHLLGIGHLARASRIADALFDHQFDVTMMTGGTPVAGFPGPNIEHIELPTIASGDAGFSGLVDSEGRPVDDAFKAHRRDILLAEYARIKPDIVMIEAFPFGRRQVRFELIPLLKAIHASPDRPRVVCSLRDILQERAKPGRDEESIDLVRQYFDLVLVHGDPKFVRLEETFPLADQIKELIAYSGLVAARPPLPVNDKFDIVASAGGGAVGIDLVRAVSEAAKRLPDVKSWCIITGPNLPDAAFDGVVKSAPKNVTVVRFRRDFPSLIANARLSISQAGYNTVCDVFNAGCRCLLIPFAAGGETEQSQRAVRLEKLGLATVIPESTLSTETMTAAIQKSLGAPKPPTLPLGLNGAAHTAKILHDMLESAE